MSVGGKAAGKIVSIVRKQKDMHTASQFSLSFSFSPGPSP